MICGTGTRLSLSLSPGSLSSLSDLSVLAVRHSKVIKCKNCYTQAEMNYESCLQFFVALYLAGGELRAGRAKRERDKSKLVARGWNNCIRHIFCIFPFCVCFTFHFSFRLFLHCQSLQVAYTTSCCMGAYNLIQFECEILPT